MMKNRNKPDVNEMSANKTANTQQGNNLRQVLEKSSGSVSSTTHIVATNKKNTERTM